MNWTPLTDAAQLQEITTSAAPCVIFKHSTRCSVSSMAKRQFEFEEELVPESAKLYLLDLIRFRSLSNDVSERWSVRHESPQVLVIHRNRCIHHASHSDIEAVQVALSINQAAD